MLVTVTVLCRDVCRVERERGGEVKEGKRWIHGDRKKERKIKKQQIEKIKEIEGR